MSRPGVRPAGFDGNPGWVRSLAYSPDGKALAIGSGNTLKLWDVIGNRLGATLEPDGFWVQSVAFAPDGQTLAAAGTVVAPGNQGGEGRVRLFDLAQAPPARRAELALHHEGRNRPNDLDERRCVHTRWPASGRHRDADDCDLGRSDRGRARFPRPPKWRLRGPSRRSRPTADGLPSRTGWDGPASASSTSAPRGRDFDARICHSAGPQQAGVRQSTCGLSHPGRAEVGAVPYALSGTMCFPRRPPATLVFLSPD